MSVESVPTVESPARPSSDGLGLRPRWSVPAAFVAVVVVGVVVGVIWSRLAPQLQYLITVVGPFPVTEATAGRGADADAWFAILSVAVGLTAGCATLVALRASSRWRSPLALALTAAGLFVMFVVGQLLVNSRLVWSWNPVAGDNHEVTGPLVVQAWGIVTIAPILALVIVLAASVASDGQRRAR